MSKRYTLERDRLTEALREREDRYNSLIDSIDEGYCVIEMRIEPGRPLDYRFLEVNRAFEQQSTLVDAQGKWMRELRPDHEEHWFEIYRDVALTGQPIRFEHCGRALNGRCFSLYAFRIGAPDQRAGTWCRESSGGAALPRRRRYPHRGSSAAFSGRDA